jgi:hypothetical protein
VLVEGVITLIIVAALFYVAPGVMYAVRASAPFVSVNMSNCGIGGLGGTVCTPNPLNASVTSIGTTAAGALNLSSIGLIMLGIGIMIGGFMLIRGQAR